MLTHKASADKTRLSPTGLILHALLKVMAANFNHRLALKKYIITLDGPLDFTFGIRTENGSVLSGIVFQKGAVSIVRGIPDNANAVIRFNTDAAVRRLLGGTSTDQIYMILKNEARVDGSITYLNLFAFLLSLLIWKKQIAAMEKERNKARKSLLKQAPNARRDLSDELSSRSKSRLRCVQVDRGRTISR